MWSPEEMQDNSIKKLGLRLTIKYVATHGLFWASYVCVGGFAALFLQGIGFSSTQVGVITAIGGVLALITQPFLG